MKGKILIVSNWGPPMIDGPSIILGNLLREFDREKTILFTRNIDKNTAVYNKKGNPLTIKKYSVYVPSPYTPGLGNFSKRLFRLMETAWIPLTIVKGVIVCLLEKVNCILATSDQPHSHFLISSYFIARLTGRRLILYLLDPVEAFRLGRIQKIVVGVFMPRLMKFASKIIVMNEILADHYQFKYGVKCEVLPHSISIKGFEETDMPENGLVNKVPEIVFSGNVSRFHEDSLLNLKKAIELISLKIKLKIYTSTRPEYLREIGFSGGNVTIDHVDHEKLMEKLKKADILFLPLSFLNSDSIVVKAAFPAKTMDYLLANRPILIHASKDSFIVDYAQKNDIAVCVTENDVNALANAIKELLQNMDLRLKLNQNCQTALLQHNSKTVYNKFLRIMGET